MQRHQQRSTNRQMKKGCLHGRDSRKEDGRTRETFISLTDHIAFRRTSPNTFISRASSREGRFVERKDFCGIVGKDCRTDLTTGTAASSRELKSVSWQLESDAGRG